MSRVLDRQLQRISTDESRLHRRSFIDVILYWFPFYYTFKVAFIIYLILPSTRVRAHAQLLSLAKLTYAFFHLAQGAEVMYGKLLKPFASQLNAKTSSTPAPAAAAPAPQ